jgi:hypothetical protein
VCIDGGGGEILRKSRWKENKVYLKFFKKEGRCVMIRKK